MRWIALLMIGLAFAGCVGEDDVPTELPPTEHPNHGLNETVNETVPVAYMPPHFPNDGQSEKTLTTIASSDGHEIPVTIYRPLIANATQQVPVLLHSHGFTGSKASADNAFEAHIAAGFGVVSFDERGHGEAKSTSSVTFMHPDAEVLDIIAIVDEIASWDWVLKEQDDPTDPVLGGIGYSYAGAMQLMGAIFDDRFDAIVPEITWNHITDALAPGGAVNSGWVALFYLAGNAQQSVTFNNEFHQGWVWAMGSNMLPAGQGGVVPDLVTPFDEASPNFYPGGLDIPTFLVQGMSDTLFPLNHAVANYEQATAMGAEARIYTHLGGHVLNTASLYPDTLPMELGLQGIPGESPCGDKTALEIAWHQKHLLNLSVDLGPEFCMALEDGRAIASDSWPMHDVNQTIALDLPAVVTAPAGAPNLFELGSPGVIVGIPKVTGTITAPSADTIVYFSLQILRADGLFEHIVNDQVRPLRLNTPANVAVPFEVDMHGVAFDASSDTVYLSISNVEPMYISNSNRVPSAAVLQDLEITLPVVSNPQFL